MKNKIKKVKIVFFQVYFSHFQLEEIEYTYR